MSRRYWIKATKYEILVAEGALEENMKKGISSVILAFHH
jgi:hypothetical protein